jgi:Lar family restriction alleviation protein
MSELKPCPFCGREAVVYDAGDTDFGPAWYVACDKCSCQIDKEHYTKAEAIAAWNQRPALEQEPVAWTSQDEINCICEENGMRAWPTRSEGLDEVPLYLHPPEPSRDREAMERLKRQSDDWQKRGWELGILADQLEAENEQLKARLQEAVTALEEIVREKPEGSLAEARVKYQIPDGVTLREE